MKIRLTCFFLPLIVLHFSYGQTKPEDLKIDTSITGFHFAADWSGTRIYTLHGQSDLNTRNPFAFAFTLFPNATYQDALKQIEHLVLMSKNDGFLHSDSCERDTTIDGYKTHFISFTETKKANNYKNFVFDAFIIKDNTAIIFVSGDLDDGKYIEKFKKTFYQINLRALKARSKEREYDGDKIFTNAEIQPTFPGNLTHYIDSVLIGAELPGKGRAIIEMIVDTIGMAHYKYLYDHTNGDISNLSLNRLINRMPPWIPGRQDGRAVNYMLILLLDFDDYKLIGVNHKNVSEEMKYMLNSNKP